MVPEDAVFWMSEPSEAPTSDASLLCRQHADAMVVPRGWTLDDRRENVLRLFRPRPPSATEPRPARASRRPRQAEPEGRPEQLQIDGTGEIARPVPPPDEPPAAAEPRATVPAAATATATWEPEFDHDDDLDGLLEVDSPLLARAFRGTGRPR